jgi:hypothetical protein
MKKNPMHGDTVAEVASQETNPSNVRHHHWRAAIATSTLLLCLCLLLGWGIAGQKASTGSAGLIKSRRAKADFALTADPTSSAWRSISGVIADRDQRGRPVPGHRTEIRSRWTEKHLYLLFVCPYEQLYLTPSPSTTTETNLLWEWDVAEAFIGTDFTNIKQYTEFQVSPQGEWVDLFIDRGTDPPNHDWTWNSGYEVKARIDEEKRVWFGEMRIPMEKIDSRPATAGQRMRINFYRMQGPPPRRNLAWQPTNSPTYHVPEAFGTLQLVP